MNNDTLSLQEVRTIYYSELIQGNTKLEFEQWLKDKYEKVYDDEFNFLGWERRT